MSNFVNDTFTGTDNTQVASHTGETGATWTAHPVYSSPNAIITSNRARNNQTGTVSAYLASGNAAGADHTVSATFRSQSTVDYLSLNARFNASQFTCYSLQAFGTSVELLRWNNNSSTTLATYSLALGVGDHSMSLEVSGTGSTVTLTPTIDGVAKTPVTDSSGSRITSGTRVGFHMFNATGTGAGVGHHLDSFTASETGPALSSGTASVTGYGDGTVDLSCTAASGGTSPYTYQWERSTTSGSGFSNVSGATSLTLNDTGLSNGTTYYYRCKATDSAGSPSTVTSNEVSATPAAVIAVNNSNLFLSPYTWRLSGSSYAQATGPGAYMKFTFVGTGASIVFDFSQLSGLSAGQYPYLRYVIDGGTATEVQLSSGVTTVTIATGLSNASHTVFAGIKSRHEPGEAWTSPKAVRVTGLIVVGTGLTTPTLRTKRMLIYGDSITEGIAALSSSSSPANNDAFQTWAWNLAEALDAEVGLVGHSAQGYTTYISNYGNVPALSGVWDDYDSANSRLSGGLLTPAPDYLVSNHGTNDGSTDVTSTVVTLLGSWRTAAGSLCQIIITAPFNRTHASQLAAAVASYKASNPEDFLVCYAEASTNSMLSSELSGDGTHPSVRGHARYGARLIAAIVTALSIKPRRRSSGIGRS